MKRRRSLAVAAALLTMLSAPVIAAGMGCSEQGTNPPAQQPVATYETTITTSMEPAPDVPPRCAGPSSPTEPTWAPAEETIASNRWRFKRCFMASVSKSGLVEGVVRVRVQLDAVGVAKSAVECTDVGKELTDCIAASFVLMTWAKPTSPVPAFTVPESFALAPAPAPATSTSAAD
jgi:hypothetical protein